jgi:hypothetical protein
MGEYEQPKITNRELAALLNVTLYGTEIHMSTTRGATEIRKRLDKKKQFFQQRIAQLDRAADLLSIFRPTK